MIRVMVVDDSALVRRIATDILNADPDVEVVATAAQAEFALQKLDKECPDVITLDLEMPGMGGLEAIKKIMATRPTPIVVMSAHAREGAEATIQALELGAVDFVLKPTGSLSGGIDKISRELTEKVKFAFAANRSSGAYSRPIESSGAASAGAMDLAAPATWGPAAAVIPVPAPERKTLHETVRWRDQIAGRPDADRRSGDIEIVAIGTSTGGPVALKSVLSVLPADFPVGIVVVQHMPPIFTKAFADRLDTLCALTVKEAENGDLIVPGRVLIAPGNRHMSVTRFGGDPRVELNQDEPVNGHRPSVDVLMHSVSREYGSRAVGVIMTGMGKDGADGLKSLHGKGGHVIAQDKESSVIFGMNREVVVAGNADEVVPLEEIAGRIAATVGQPTPQRKVR
jgi:two-component system, chemotaxis family, protein-glutamate methylesterase/glutaminase